MKGESHTYSWENGPPRKFDQPVEPNIQMANLRSKWRPYLIFEPGVKIDGFGIPPSTDYSKFPCWNHWPVAQLPNDGRKAIVSDRPSHFSLSSSRPTLHRGEKNSVSGVFLYGMTDQPVASLVHLARSWNSPPVVTLKGNGFQSYGYDKFQRAYVLECRDEADRLEFTLEASKDSPVVNPAFVVKNWGGRSVSVQINGKEIPRGKALRYGLRRTLEGHDLIVWVKMREVKETGVRISSLGGL